MTAKKKLERPSSGSSKGSTVVGIIGASSFFVGSAGHQFGIKVLRRCGVKLASKTHSGKILRQCEFPLKHHFYRGEQEQRNKQIEDESHARVHRHVRERRLLASLPRIRALQQG